MFRVRASKTCASSSIRSEMARMEGCRHRASPAGRSPRRIATAPKPTGGSRKPSAGSSKRRSGSRPAVELRRRQFRKLGGLTDDKARSPMGEPTRGLLTPLRGCGQGRVSDAAARPVQGPRIDPPRPCRAPKVAGRRRRRLWRGLPALRSDGLRPAQSLLSRISAGGTVDSIAVRGSSTWQLCVAPGGTSQQSPGSSEISCPSISSRARPLIT